MIDVLKKDTVKIICEIYSKKGEAVVAISLK